MPWCPKCRNEYREGILECSECKVPLVETYDEIISSESAFVPLFSSEKKDLLERFISYLDYSGITRHSLTSDEYELVWSVSVCEENLDEAKKLYKGFSIAEKERAAIEAFKEMQESEESDDSKSEEKDLDSNETGVDDKDVSEAAFNDSNSSEDGYSDFEDLEKDNKNSSDAMEETTTEETDDESSDEYAEQLDDEDELAALAKEKIESDDLMEELHGASKAYVRKADQFKDYQFSAITCVFCGAVGVIFCILNMLGIINVFPVLFSQLVMMVVFAMFLFSGIFIYVKSKQIKNQIDDQVDVEGQVKVWLDTNVTNEYLNTIKDEDVSDEVNYFNYSEEVKKWLMNDLPFVDESMAEALTEEHFNKIL